MTSEFDPEGVAALSNRLGMCLVTSVLTLLLLRAADCRPTLRSIDWNKNFRASCYGDLGRAADTWSPAGSRSRTQIFTT